MKLRISRLVVLVGVLMITAVGVALWVNQPSSPPVIGESQIMPVQCPQNNHVVHFIQYGDTLWDLSLRYETDLQSLLDFNHLNQWEAEHLPIGFPVCVPNIPS